MLKSRIYSPESSLAVVHFSSMLQNSTSELCLCYCFSMSYFWLSQVHCFVIHVSKTAYMSTKCLIIEEMFCTNCWNGRWLIFYVPIFPCHNTHQLARTLTTDRWMTLTMATVTKPWVLVLLRKLSDPKKPSKSGLSRACWGEVDALWSLSHCSRCSWAVFLVWQQVLSCWLTTVFSVRWCHWCVAWSARWCGWMVCVTVLIPDGIGHRPRYTLNKITVYHRIKTRQSYQSKFNMVN